MRYVDSHDFFSMYYAADESLNRQWRNYVNEMNLPLPDFTEMIKIIKEKMFPYWIRLGEGI